MRRTIYLILLSLITISRGMSQVTVDTTIKLDLLKSPASPAFNILGIAQSDVERPTDLSSFAMSVQNASNNFTSFPASYAFQVAPFLMGRRKYSLNEFDNNTHAFKQSFEISVGYTYMGPKGKEEVDSLKAAKIGLGIKFSIIRPAWTPAAREKYMTLVKAQADLLEAYRLAEKNNELNDTLMEKRRALQVLDAKDSLTTEEKRQFDQLRQEIAQLTEEIGDQSSEAIVSTQAFESAKKAATAFTTERKGFFLDFSSGGALDFPGNRFNSSRVYRAGAWLTGGHENGNHGITSLFIVRYLYNPETLFADPGGLLKPGGNLSTFDAGGRFVLDVSHEKFTLSAEAIYRSILGSSVVDPSWRFVMNAEYGLGMNKKLTFAFGRDFDGTISKGGNLVAAINFLAGFGADRKISDK